MLSYPSQVINDYCTWNLIVDEIIAKPSKIIHTGGVLEPPFSMDKSINNSFRTKVVGKPIY